MDLGSRVDVLKRFDDGAVADALSGMVPKPRAETRAALGLGAAQAFGVGMLVRTSAPRGRSPCLSFSHGI